MARWFEVPRDEQETLMNVDYCAKTLTVYTNRKSVAIRLENKFGQPDKVDTCNNLISGVTYVRNIYDKDIKYFFSKMLIIGAFKEKRYQDGKQVEKE